MSTVIRHLVPALLVSAFVALPAAERVITVHLAAPVAVAPVLDGKLDDACWKTLPKTTTMYNFWNIDPTPAKSQSEFQIGYNAAGLYLGFRLWDDNMAKIKASSTQRGDGSLWCDDSCEVYVDPTAAAVGFRRFTFNSLATQAGTFQLDGANVDQAWNPDGWQVATSKDDKGWSAEMFLPVKDLDRMPKAGALWRFAMVRLAYSSEGLFAASAPGAKFFNPGAFGWLYFLDQAEAAPLTVGKQLAGSISGDWLLPMGASAVACKNGSVSIVPLSKPVTDGSAAVQQGLDAVRKLPGATAEAPTKELAAVAEALGKIPQTITDAAVFCKSVQDTSDLNQRLENVEYALKVAELLARNAPPTAKETPAKSGF